MAALPPMANNGFYRTSKAAEIDLVVEFSIGNRWPIESKRSSVPKVSRRFYEACRDLTPSKKFLVCPSDQLYPTADAVQVTGLRSTLELIEAHQ